MFSLRQHLLLAFALLPGTSIFAEEKNSVRRTEDVIYGRKSGMALTLDVFEPAQPNGCGVLFLVNGGWLSSKSTPLMVTIRPGDYEPYLNRGYTVFAVVTSSQPKFTIREEMEDVQRGDISHFPLPRAVAQGKRMPRTQWSAKAARSRPRPASFRRRIS